MRGLLTIISFVAGLFFAGASAAEKKEFLLFSLSQGDKVCIKMEDAAKISFEDGVASVGTERFLLSNLRKYIFATAEEAANCLEAVQDGKGLRLEGKTLYVRSQEAVHVYGINGVEIKSPIRRTGELTTLNLGSLPDGVYLVSVGKETFKINIK